MSSHPTPYLDPYDAVDDLPEYPFDANEGPEATSRRFFGRSGGRAEDSAPLIKSGRKEGEPIPMDVDGFAYELVRVHHDIGAFRDAVVRLSLLQTQVLALAPEDSTLVAQSLLADLAVQTIAAARAFPDLPVQLRAFGDKVDHLKPGPGRFLITDVEIGPIKRELATCAEMLLAAIQQISRIAEKENRGKPQARVRLLKVIKAQMGEGTDDAQTMAALLTDEREGSSMFPEHMKAGSPSWRWAVEHPFTRLVLEVRKVGDLAFLDRFATASTPSPSTWFNPLAYVPALASKGPKPPGYSAPFTASRVDGSVPLPTYQEEARIGSYGELLETPRATAPSWWGRAALGIVVLAVLGGSAAGIARWSKKVHEASGAADMLPAASLGV